MRILALDLGKRRIGLAISDELGITAQGLPTLQRKNNRTDLAALARIVGEKAVDLILIGEPLHMSGDAGIMSNRAHKFGEALHEVSGLPVEYCDERLTSVEARRILQESGVPPKKARGQIDAVAAAVILQSYLNTLRPPRSGHEPLEDRYR